jgi:hypothetical protein
MYEYRQVPMRMRLGDSDRTISKAGLMGRRKAAELRLLAAEAGWLDMARPLPEDAVLAARLARECTVGSYSSVRRFLQQLEAEHPTRP